MKELFIRIRSLNNESQIHPPRAVSTGVVRAAAQTCQTVRSLRCRDREALPKVQHPATRLGILGEKRSGKESFSGGFSSSHSDVVTIGGNERYGWRQQESDEELLAATITPPPPFPDGLPEVTARARELVGKVRAIGSLTNPHPAIAKLLQEDEERREKQKASRWQRWPSSYDAPLFDSPFERRRLRLINSLLLAFAQCSCAAALNGREADSLSVQVGDQHLGFSVGPVNPKSERQYPRKPIPAAAKMKVELSWYQPPPEIKFRWQDEDKARLEDQLEEIAIGLVVAGEWAYRDSIRRNYEYRLCGQRGLKEDLSRSTRRDLRGLRPASLVFELHVDCSGRACATRSARPHRPG